MKNIIRVLIILVVIALLVIGGIKAVKDKRAKEAALPPAKTYTIKVKTIKVEPKDITLTLPILAIVENDSDVKISSKVAERVESINKSRGQKVKKGEVLVKLDSRDVNSKILALKSKIFSMQINLNNLQTIHKRSKQLLKVDGVSVEQFEKEASSIASLKAQIASLKAGLAELYALKTYTVLKSPIDGVVSKLFVSVGDMAMPGKPLMQISSPKGAYIVVRVPSDINAKSLIFKNKEYPLTPLDNTFNSLNEYRTPHIEDNLTEGQRVDGKLVVYKGKGILLPNDLILNRDAQEYIVLANGKKGEGFKISPVAQGQEGVVVKDTRIADKDIVSEKPDILLKLLSGAPLEIIK